VVAAARVQSPSFFSSFSKSALNVASALTIASKDFFTAAGKSSASMFCHFNSSRDIVLHLTYVPNLDPDFFAKTSPDQ
jgi:hypothetical protein